MLHLKSFIPFFVSVFLFDRISSSRNSSKNHNISKNHTTTASNHVSRVSKELIIEFMKRMPNEYMKKKRANKYIDNVAPFKTEMRILYSRLRDILLGDLILFAF